MTLFNRIVLAAVSAFLGQAALAVALQGHSRLAFLFILTTLVFALTISDDTFSP